MHAGGALARGEKPRHGRRGGRRVDLDAAHDVVAGRADLHRLAGDVDVGEFGELVVHRRQPAPDVLRVAARGDVEIDPAVGRATPGLDLGVDGPRHLVPGEQFRWPAGGLLVRVPAVGLLLGVGGLGGEDRWDVVEHEATSLGVEQHAAVAPDALGDEDPLYRRWPDHPGGMELDELHVHQRGPGPQRERVAVAGVLPRVRRHLVGLADPAGGEHHRGCVETHESAGLTPVREGAGDPPTLVRWCGRFTGFTWCARYTRLARSGRFGHLDRCRRPGWRGVRRGQQA